MVSMQTVFMRDKFRLICAEEERVGADNEASPLAMKEKTADSL